jgi:hypothetical protein
MATRLIFAKAANIGRTLNTVVSNSAVRAQANRAALFDVEAKHFFQSEFGF